VARNDSSPSGMETRLLISSCCGWVMLAVSRQPPAVGQKRKPLAISLKP
jgi:hypothetical protein